jgi:hypothetical protein
MRFTQELNFEHMFLSCSFTNYFQSRDHLYRKHTIPIHCPRCYTVFAKSQELTAHNREAVPCSIKPQPDDFEGLTEEQNKQLHSRKGLKGKSEVQKWRGIYHILFPLVPTDEIPDPCKLKKT